MTRGKMYVTNIEAVCEERKIPHGRENRIRG
jgi:hypothetical protein